LAKPSGDVRKRRNFFPKAYYKHTSIFSYLALLTSYCKVQEYWESDFWCTCDGQLCSIVSVFPKTMRFWTLPIKLAWIFLATLNCIFKGASFELSTQVAGLIPKKFVGF